MGHKKNKRKLKDPKHYTNVLLNKKTVGRIKVLKAIKDFKTYSDTIDYLLDNKNLVSIEDVVGVTNENKNQ